jgi:hypothetical protein
MISVIFFSLLFLPQRQARPLTDLMLPSCVSGIEDKTWAPKPYFQHVYVQPNTDIQAVLDRVPSWTAIHFDSGSYYFGKPLRLTRADVALVGTCGTAILHLSRGLTGPIFDVGKNDYVINFTFDTTDNDLSLDVPYNVSIPVDTFDDAVTPLQPVKCTVVSLSSGGVTVECPETHMGYRIERWPEEWAGKRTKGSVYRLIDNGTGLEFLPNAAYCTTEFKRRARRAERETPHQRISFQNLIAPRCEELLRPDAGGDENNLFSDNPQGEKH